MYVLIMQHVKSGFEPETSQKIFTDLWVALTSELFDSISITNIHTDDNKNEIKKMNK